MTAGGHSLADRVKAWLLDRLDNDSVRPWIPPFCAAWLTWAVLAAVWLPPVTIIEDAMGHTAYVLWVLMAIPGNLTPIVGLRMRHGGSSIHNMSDELLARDWAGLFLQTTGHAVCCVLLLMFEVAAVIGAVTYSGPNVYAGVTVFAAFMLLPWTGATALLCAQAMRKVQRGLALEHEVRG